MCRFSCTLALRAPARRSRIAVQPWRPPPIVSPLSLRPVRPAPRSFQLPGHCDRAPRRGATLRLHAAAGGASA
eukprot:7518186-Alexandrium_andersonii.AAC.1